MLDYTSLGFPAPPPLRPYVILNMILTVDGRTGLPGPRTLAGSATDRRLMRELRSHVDAVLIGGETFRSVAATPRLSPVRAREREAAVQPRPAPLAVVLSASGDLPLDRPFFTSTDFEGIVYLSDGCPAARRAAIEATGRATVTVPGGEGPGFVLRDLRSRLGIRRLLLESGPRLNEALLREQAIDEWFLTISPMVAGSDSAAAITPNVRVGDPTEVELLSCRIAEDTGEVFLRYRRHRAVGPAQPPSRQL